MPVDDVPSPVQTTRGEESSTSNVPTQDGQETDYSSALFGAALLYVVVTFGAIFGSVPLLRMGPLSLPIPLFLFGFPLLALSSMVILRVGSVRFHWMAMVGFTIIILGTAYLQLLVFAHASASV